MSQTSTLKKVSTLSPTTTATLGVLSPQARDDKMPSGIPFIVANEFAERFCYYGINAILTIYMTQFLRLGDAQATTWHSLFKSGAYFSPLIGAIVSDVFWGKFRGTDEEAHHLHESPPAMTIVLWILAIGSIVSGWVGIPDSLLPENLEHFGDLMGKWLAPVVAAQSRSESKTEFLVMAGMAMCVSIIGIAIAASMYLDGVSERSKAFIASIEGVRKIVFNKYYVDEFYDLVIVRPVRFVAYMLWKVFDNFIIDGLVNLSAAIVGFAGRGIKYLQNGDVQRYVVGVIAGTGIIFYAATHWTVAGVTFFVPSASDFDVKKDGQDITVIAKGGGQTGQRLKYRVRWENGGDEKFDKVQSQTTFKHHYDMVGKKQITVRAIDERWGVVHDETHTVEVK